MFKHNIRTKGTLYAFYKPKLHKKNEIFIILKKKLLNLKKNK